jgi:hypothetical protein
VKIAKKRKEYLFRSRTNFERKKKSFERKKIIHKKRIRKRVKLEKKTE